MPLRSTDRGWPARAGVLVLAACSLPAALGGCAAAIVAGVATGAAVVHDRRPTGTVLADEMIELQAMHLLHEHPEIAGRSSISIDSYDLVVLLTGQAQTAEVRDRFAGMVAGLPKVEKVVNEVRIGPSLDLSAASHDLYLASRCKLAIANVNLPGFDPLRVQVISASGKVYLRGLVTAKEAQAAVEQVRYVPGVTEVVKLFEYLPTAP